MISTIKNYLEPADSFVFGVADLRGLLIEEFKEYPFGISIAKKLDDHIVDGIENGPTQAYISHNEEVNSELQNIASNISCELNKNNIIRFRTK